MTAPEPRDPRAARMATALVLAFGLAFMISMEERPLRGPAAQQASASVGTATPTIGDTTADLLARADAAMYRAKKQRTHRDTSPDPCGPGPQPVSRAGSRSRPAR